MGMGLLELLFIREEQLARITVTMAAIKNDNNHVPFLIFFISLNLPSPAEESASFSY
jgi:hypothetical protein